MVSIPELWLPIVLSAVIVFIASSIIHMVLPIHKSDYKKLPNEERVLEALRGETLAPPGSEPGEFRVPGEGLAPGPGLYHFPHCADMKQMGSPEMVEKYKKGPVGLLTIIPSGPPNMGKFLGMWFVYCLAIGFMVAYLTGRTLGPGTPYLAVFRVAGTAAFLGYAGAHAADAIWKGQQWSTTLKHIFDGLVYGLLTAGVFGWLWPR